MTPNETVDTVYERLYEESENPRQRESLCRIKKAADYMIEQGLKVTPSSIERYCLDRDWGGPKAQSIRNSKVLNNYLTIRASEQTIRPNRKVAPKKPLITDETLRAYIQLLEEERDQAVAARLRVENGLRKIPGISIDEVIRVGFGAPAAQPSAVTSSTSSYDRLPKAVVDAIGLLFNPEHLADCGLQLHKDRLRQSITGNVLLEKNHIESLRSLVIDPD